MSLLPVVLVAVLAQADAPPSGSAEPIQVFSGHSGPVYAVDISPSGDVAATASFDGTLKIWDVSDGTQRATFSDHKGKVMSVAFSPDGRSLLSGGEDKTVKLWDVPLRRASSLAVGAGQVEVFALHRKSGRLVTGASAGSLLIWDLAGEKQERKLEPPVPGLRALAVGPSGNLVAAAGDDRIVRVWNLAPEPVKPKKESAVEGLALIKPGDKWRFRRGKAPPPADWNKPGFDASAWEYLPSGFGYGTNPAELKTVKTRLDDMKKDKYLSVFVRSKFKVADPARIRKLTLKVVFDDGFVVYLNGAEVARENIEGKAPGFGQGASATVSDALEKQIDLTAHLKKLKAGENTLAVQGHNTNVSSSDFVLTPSLFAASTVSPPPKKDKQGPLQLAGAEGSVRGLCFSPTGSQLAAVGDDKSVRVWQLSDGKELVRLQGASAGRDLVYIDQNTLCVAGTDGVISVWNVKGARLLRSLSGHTGPVRALGWFQSNRRLASAGEDGSVRLWSPQSGKALQQIAGHEGAVFSVSFSPDGKLLVSGGADKTLRAWDPGSGKPVAYFENADAVRDTAIAPDGRFYIAAGGDGMLAWKTPSAAAVRTYTGHGGFVHAVCFAPDGKTIAAAGQDKTIRIWGLDDGKQLHSIKAHDSTIYSLLYSPDGKQLCSGGFDKVAKLWNASNGIEVRKFHGHTEGIFCLRFSTDGRQLFSGSSDLTIRRWDTAAGKELAVYEGHGGWVTGLGLRPSGTQLISVDYSGGLFTWNIADGRILARRRIRPVVYGLAVAADGRKLVTANPANSAMMLSQ